MAQKSETDLLGQELPPYTDRDKSDKERRTQQLRDALLKHNNAKTAIVSCCEKSQVAPKPIWAGNPNHQFATVGGVRLEVHRNTDGKTFTVKVGAITVSDDALGLIYARRQALYELEAAIIKLQADVKQLWGCTP